MGYRKIVQYGNVTEVYDYDKELYRNSRKQSHLKVQKLLQERYAKEQPYKSQLEIYRANIRRKQALKSQSKNLSKKKRIRSERSINRSRFNFFRLVHHNNCLANSINFVTLTFAYDLSFIEADRAVREFFQSLRSNFTGSSISYISVPELTKKQRYHFHLLVYNLPSEVASIERKTRNLQRQFLRGFVDVVCASYTSKGIAGYMAKYLQKSFSDERYENPRGYNCSRNIEKIRSYGSNTLDSYNDVIIPSDSLEELQIREYDVPYMGRCLYTKITTQHASEIFKFKEDYRKEW